MLFCGVAYAYVVDFSKRVSKCKFGLFPVLMYPSVQYLFVLSDV